MENRKRMKNTVILLFLMTLLVMVCRAEIRKQKKVKCHPSCCQKPKKPKSLIGRYMIDAVDGSEHSGDDVFDLVYVLIKLAKGTYYDFAENDIAENRKATNETMHGEYRLSDNMIPYNPMMYNRLTAAKRSAVRTRYAPGNGVSASIDSNGRFQGSGGSSPFKIPMPQVNFDTKRFLGLNVSTQAAVAVSNSKKLLTLVKYISTRQNL